MTAYPLGLNILLVVARLQTSKRGRVGLLSYRGHTKDSLSKLKKIFFDAFKTARPIRSRPDSPIVLEQVPDAHALASDNIVLWSVVKGM